MNFVSYAQNFEDVMLWRALKHIEHGQYVDIGAQHPLVDSVSKAFHEQGWRGVHIEPVPAYADLLRQDRPGDTVLQMALSDSEGVLELNVIPDTGLSTAVDAYAERHLAEHGFAHTTLTVPMLTMKTALQFLDGKEVHWLKIDVEGLEEKVLRGWDPVRLRPWIMVIEATVPTTAEVDYMGWDPLVTAAGYRFAYFDGLNRFYVADEHPELLDAFSSPPNVFDNARLSGMANSELCRGVIANNQAEANEIGAKLAAAEQERAAAEQECAAAEQELSAQRERIARLEAEAVTLRDFARLPAHIEWMQGQHDMALRETARLHGHIASMQAQQDAAQRETARVHAHIAWMEEQQDTALRETARLHAHIEWMQRQSDAAMREREHLAAGAEALRQQVHAFHSSTSWRVTAPMRLGIDLARRVKRVLRRLVRGPAPSVAPTYAAAPVQAMPAAGEVEQQVLRELSPRANRILAEIHQVINSKAG